MRDGGQTALAWCGHGLPADTPTILVLHTLTGSPQSMAELVQDLHRETGWRVVVCLRRGHADLPLSTPRLNILGCTDDLREQLQASVDGLTQVLGADQVGLALFDGPRQRLVVQADHPAPGNQSAKGLELPLTGNLSMQRVIETRRPLMVLDAQHDPLMSHVQQLMERQQVQSILLVPLIVRDEVIGTIGIDVLRAPRAFSAEDIDLAQTVANLVAVRIEQARLFEAERVARQQAQRHAQDLTGLYTITRTTSRSSFK